MRISASKFIERFVRIKDADMQRLEPLKQLPQPFHRDVAAYVWKVPPERAGRILNDLLAAGMVAHCARGYWRVTGLFDGVGKHCHAAWHKSHEGKEQTAESPAEYIARLGHSAMADAEE